MPTARCGLELSCCSLTERRISAERKPTVSIQSPVRSVNTVKITEAVQDLVGRAEGGDLDAQYDLAESYRQGGDGFARNYVEAEKWYLPGAEQGHGNAQQGLGLLYLKGLGKRVEGIRLLGLAGRQGGGYACYELARALSGPGGEGSDPAAAYLWFCLAEAYGRACEKEILTLESKLSVKQILAAQLRIREEFRPLVVLEAREEAEAQRAAVADEARRAKSERCVQEMRQLWRFDPTGGSADA